MTQNTQAKTTDESPVYIDEAEIFNPAENEAARLREELKEEREKYLRLAAEYENYRRRTKSEQASAADKGKRELLGRIISLADDFDLVIANLKNSPDEHLVEGLQLIERRLKAVLNANNVTAFNSAGEIFNPEIHEAFDVAPGANGESGKVYSELRRGYLWNDKLLRPALVVVSE